MIFGNIAIYYSLFYYGMRLKFFTIIPRKDTVNDERKKRTFVFLLRSGL